LKLLVKVGGTLLDDAVTRKSVAEQLSLAAREHQLVVVHGGGKQMTRYLEERGISSRFVNGLRVSDEAVIDAASKVIAGSVNKQLVAALIAAGQLAIGLSGVDGRLTDASLKDRALGFVGTPAHSNGTLLQLLVTHGYLPVVACIAGDRNGTIYNVNADQMAVSCAVGFGADKLVFLTDVAGVRDASGDVLRNLTLTDISALIESGVAHGGMQAKLEAAAYAVQSGVHEIVIAPGLQPNVLAAVLSNRNVGTEITTPSERPLP
jgi:acetylglutamate kinase